MDFETVIGLETHVQLSTKTKIFSGASTAFGAGPNTNVEPITLALPGTLPVLNEVVVDYAIMLGLATNCEIRKANRFARKHYFYPDLPKGYQISQFEEPICERGHIIVRNGETARPIGITRIHMEEDAGKSIHEPAEQASLVDLNRTGVPLLEVVSEPEIRSASEASAYLRTLRQISLYLGICDGNMEQGSLRCDANISLRPVGEEKLGTRAEIKNINSFKFVEKAIEYEVARQMTLLNKGEEIVQETRLFDPESGTTRSMRSKEESADYRYFPDPDLPPLDISTSWIEQIRTSMPQLPEEHFQKLVAVYGLSEYDAGVLTADRAIVEFFEKVFGICSNAKATSNWITSELFGLLKKENLEFSENPISAEHIGDLIKLVDSEVLSGKMAKTVFEEMFSSGKPPEEIVEEKGLKQITDPEEIRKAVIEAFEQNQKQLKDFLDGNEKLIGFFVGQVMKATGGSANPKTVNSLVLEEAEKQKA